MEETKKDTTEKTETPEKNEEQEIDVEKMKERLDNLLNGTENINSELESLKEVIDKQNQVIEKHLQEIAELKKVNLQLANHNPNQKVMTTEEMLAEAFGA